MSDPVWEPPLSGTESEHLVGMLDRLRWTLRWKVDGLDAEQLAFRLPSSELSLGVLLKHLAYVEDTKFTQVLFGTTPRVMAEVPDGRDAREWFLTLDASDTPASLYERWDAAVGRSRAALGTMLAGDGLDVPAAVQFGDVRPSRRRFICDLIEEYGRHTGHADLIREAIDGRVGEDPPADWRPSSG